MLGWSCLPRLIFLRFLLVELLANQGIKIWANWHGSNMIKIIEIKTPASWKLPRFHLSSLVIICSPHGIWEIRCLALFTQSFPCFLITLLDKQGSASWGREENSLGEACSHVQVNRHHPTFCLFLKNSRKLFNSRCFVHYFSTWYILAFQETAAHCALMAKPQKLQTLVVAFSTAWNDGTTATQAPRHACPVRFCWSIVCRPCRTRQWGLGSA